jgi:hypothetical protein
MQGGRFHKAERIKVSDSGANQNKTRHLPRISFFDTHDKPDMNYHANSHTHGNKDNRKDRTRSLRVLRNGRPRNRSMPISVSMPLCKNCPHSGSHHHWKVARLHGRCQNQDCGCIGYVPNVDMPKPVNKVMGSALYKKHHKNCIEPLASAVSFLMRRSRGEWRIA